MKRFLMIGLLAMTVLLLIVGCSSKQSNPQSTLYTYEEGNRTFTYDYQPSDIGPCMDWIRTNTPEDAVFLCWWDYGHTIRDLGKRDVIIFSPSYEMDSEHTAGHHWNVEKSGELASQERIQDVALALLALDSTQTIEIMHKYNATYIFIHHSDITKSWAMYYVLGEPSSTSTDTVLSKTLNKEDIQHFKLAYTDQVATIYELVD